MYNAIDVAAGKLTAWPMGAAFTIHLLQLHMHFNDFKYAVVACNVFLQDFSGAGLVRVITDNAIDQCNQYHILNKHSPLIRPPQLRCVSHIGLNHCLTCMLSTY